MVATGRRKGDPMTDSRPPEERYHAYLVRLWQDRPDSPWRAFVRDCADDEERRFATVEELFLFLHRQTDGRHQTEENDHQARTERGGDR
jgi:hypothetical protein